jgi:hypothetical protein
MEDSNSSLTPLENLILTKYPYPIAVGYRRLLDATDWELKTKSAIKLFEYGLRALALGVISEYLMRDATDVVDPALNKLLRTKLPRATLGSWKEMFFATLKAYADKRDLFFMRELYDLYWDTSRSPHRA